MSGAHSLLRRPGAAPFGCSGLLPVHLTHLDLTRHPHVPTAQHMR
jgi:hypothetical protein